MTTKQLDSMVAELDELKAKLAAATEYDKARLQDKINQLSREIEIAAWRYYTGM